jgi:hypothetical protein
MRARVSLTSVILSTPVRSLYFRNVCARNPSPLLKRGNPPNHGLYRTRAKPLKSVPRAREAASRTDNLSLFFSSDTVTTPLYTLRYSQTARASSMMV